MFVAPELQLLRLAARPVLRPDDKEALRKTIAAVTDWPGVIEGARRNRVTPLVLATLQSSGLPQIPPDVIAQLHRLTVRWTAGSLTKIPAIEALSRTLSEAGIRFLILKGIPLSLQLYNDATRRAADDIDVWVPPDQFWRADATLVQGGYRRGIGAWLLKHGETYEHWIKHIAYTNETSGTVIELHHRVTANPYLLQWSFDEVWNEREELTVGAARIATLPRARLALYLCTHGANHGWERLRWLVDLAAVVERPEAAEAAIADAEQAGLGPVMLHALGLAHAWLAMPLAPGHLAKIQGDAQVKRLDRRLKHFLGGTIWRRRPRPNSLEWFWRYSIWLALYKYSLKNDRRYHAHQWANLWMHPPDWDVVRLPKALFWLYPLLRPFGWLIRRLQR